MSERNPTYGALKITPTYAVAYYRPVNPYSPSASVLPKLNKPQGNVSRKASTKIKNSVNWMLYVTDKKKVFSIKENKEFYFYLNFITLTLPSKQRHSDDFIKREMLVPFIQWLTKTQGAYMWLWKAEAQCNGNIHFHITTHVFVHWKSIRAKWNYICAKHGYVKMFQDGSNDKGDAATQVKAAKNPNQVGGYLSKYIGKDDRYKVAPRKMKKRKWKLLRKKLKSSNVFVTSEASPFKRWINGRLWACSNNIASVECSTSEMVGTGGEFFDIYDDFHSITDEVKGEKWYEVLCYKHAKFVKLPTYVQYALADGISSIKQAERTQITVESLFE